MEDVNRLSNNGYGQEIGHTSSGEGNLSDDSHNKEFYSHSMNISSQRRVNFIKFPHLVKDAKNPDCHVIGTIFSGKIWQ